MQDLDVALQTAVEVRSELWSLITNLPEKKLFTDIEIPLTFYENGHIIAWGNDSEHFTPATFRLVRQLWLAPNHSLSKEDVRWNVQGDEESKPPSIRMCISRARLELADVNFPYEIMTLRGRGYRLSEVLQT